MSKKKDFISSLFWNFQKIFKSDKNVLISSIWKYKNKILIPITGGICYYVPMWLYSVIFSVVINFFIHMTRGKNLNFS